MRIYSKGNYMYVSGYSYPLQDKLKSHNFIFKEDNEIWTRWGYDPSIFYELVSLIRRKPKLARPIPSSLIRCEATNNKGGRCKHKRKKGKYCTIHHLKFNKNMHFL